MNADEHFPLTEAYVAKTPNTVTGKPVKNASVVQALSLILARQNDIFNELAEMREKLASVEAAAGAAIHVEGSVKGSVYGKASLEVTLVKALRE